MLFLAFIIGVLIAILIGVTLTGVYFVLLIIVVVILCIYFIYRLGKILDSQRRILEGFFETKMQKRGDELYKNLTPN